MTRKALVVGIDYYTHGNSLFGCVDDAHHVSVLLERNGDGSVNFDVKLRTGTGPADVVKKSDLMDDIKKLFQGDSEIALFYFAGHGHLEATGGFIMASDSQRGDDGVSLDAVIALANGSEAKNKIIVLDSCHSGIAGTPPAAGNNAVLSEGLTILAASTAEQYASEENDHGIFTTLFVDALSGPAANLVGDISPGSIYAHIDQSLGAWRQRPVFKTNVKTFVSLRKVQPPIFLSDLQRILEFFPTRGSKFALDPTYEQELKGRDPGMPEPIPEHTQKFAVLQRFNRLNLVVPVDAPHMWHAAMQSKSCKLTALGEHYRQLVELKRI